LHVKLKRM